jgi:hypothetical protein
VQCATASSAPSATFTCEDMTNYARQRENFFITVGPKMKPKMKLTVLKCLKCFFDDELVELIILETNTYAA